MIILYYLTFFFKNIFYFYSYFIIFSIFCGVLDLSYIILLESYYFIKNEYDSLYYEYLINKNNLKRFVKSSVLIKLKNKFVLLGYLNNIYIKNHDLFFKKVYLILDDNLNLDEKFIKLNNLLINISNVKCIKHIDDKRSKYLFELVIKYSDLNLPEDILKTIDDYI